MALAGRCGDCHAKQRWGKLQEERIKPQSLVRAEARSE
jgi:hypothetical protein